MKLPRDRIAIRRALRAWCRVHPRRLPDGMGLRPADWRRLAGLARREGVAGLLHGAVHGDPAADAPSEIRKRLRATAYAQTAVHAREERVLTEVVDAFHHRGIHPVLLRGLGLVEALYEDGSQRPQIDHDLLVLPGEEGEAREALRRAGFRAAPGGGGPYRREASVVDLHTDPYDRRRARYRSRLIRACPQELIRCARWTRVAGRLVRTPAPEDRMLTLAVHVVKHSFDRLIRLVDIAECWRLGGFEPDDLLRRARAEGTAQALYYASAAAFVLLDAEIPLGWLSRAYPERRPVVDHGFRRVLDGRPVVWFDEVLALSRLAGTLPRAQAMFQMLRPSELRSRARAAGPLTRMILFPTRLGRIAVRAAATVTRR